ncbi:hyaluronan-mediated motility receptor-like [Mytilus trossulus]|uniref:hyaluronan-mediated motility receptor-like n=1 Tax=Mytilus trossulus TaxID=6551 RepID=UPI003004A397
MSDKGKKKGKMSQTTPAKGTRQSPRIKKPEQPEAMDTATELSNSADKLQSLKITEKKENTLPGFYEELKLPRALYDLAESIQKSSNKVLANKDVQKNFEEAQQIFQGWATPVKGQESKGRSNKRKRSDGQNGDGILTPVEITELQDSAKKLKEELTKQQEEKALLSKVRDNVIEQLKDDNRKLQQDLTSNKETIATTEQLGKIEMNKRTMEIQFLEEKLRKAHTEITKLKETIEENEKKFLEKTVVQNGEEMPNEKDTKSEEFLQELKSLQNQLIEEQKAHQKTKKEEKLEREELQKLKEELLYEKDTLTNELTQVRADKQQKNEELESIGNELIRSSDFNERKSRECESLKDQIGQMQNELKQKNEELDDLRNRLSSLSASKLDGDPNITDLGDPNRPLKLVERYQQLYDNLWTDIFDELTDSYHDVGSSSEREKMAAMEIMSIFERVLQFCKHLVEDQEKTIISTLTCCSPDNLDQNASNIDISTIRNIRKSNAQQTLPSIVQQYARQNEQELSGLMKDFAEECIAICWLTQVQDPPIAFEFSYAHGVQLDKDLMREFTVSGDIVDFVVWPTMRLTSDGPVMVKSVVQPIKKKR